MSTNLWKAVRVPFDGIRYAYRELRKALFTAPRPGGTYLAVEVTLDELEETLGGQSYAPNWEFSYYERGEDFNVARVVYERHTVEGRQYVWWQTHVRGWETDEGTIELSGHWELEPTENGNAHIDGVGFSLERGREHLADALERAGVAYTETEVEGASH